jgi:hypothetical protein
MGVKKISLILLFLAFVLTGFAQDEPEQKPDRKKEKKDARRERINALMKQSEEGVLIFSKQNVFGLQFRTNGYGAFYEMGRMKSNRKTALYRIDFTEIKNPKEEKLPSGNVFFGNPFIYGKINYFYQFTLGYGQQYVLGQKGNKNGVAVTAVYHGGVSIGLLRPYYVEVVDGNSTRVIKYSQQDSAAFLGPSIFGGGGFGKGWGEMKVKPGAFAKAAIRFDYGRFNEVVSGIEIGMSMEAYTEKIPIMLFQKDKQIFYQGYLALLFGRRK